jgi:hypothetical protein
MREHDLGRRLQAVASADVVEFGVVGLGVAIMTWSAQRSESLTAR